MQVEQAAVKGEEWERLKERDEEWVSKSRGPTHRWPCAWRCLWRSRPQGPTPCSFALAGTPVDDLTVCATIFNLGPNHFLVKGPRLGRLHTLAGLIPIPPLATASTRSFRSLPAPLALHSRSTHARLRPPRRSSLDPFALPFALPLPTRAPLALLSFFRRAPLTLGYSRLVARHSILSLTPTPTTSLTSHFT
jgi:hypothetical protein